MKGIQLKIEGKDQSGGSGCYFHWNLLPNFGGFLWEQIVMLFVQSWMDLHTSENMEDSR